jgi:hypothetical protein
MLIATRQMVFEWSHVCGEQENRFAYRLDICLPKGPLDDFKKGGNGRCQVSESDSALIH